MIRLVASDFATHHRPSKCELRVFLKHKGEPEAKPGPYDEVLHRLGQRHERNHLSSFDEYAEIGRFPREERVAATLAAIASSVHAIYQPVFVLRHAFLGTEIEIEGIPDLIVRDRGGYIIRDVKMARRIDEKHHPEIVLQIQLYGWLFEQSCGTPPKALQVWGGTNEITEVAYDAGAALKGLERLVAVVQQSQEPYEPVGWSKCGGCGFHDRCWARAEESNDVSLVVGVDQGLARTLHGQGVHSRAEFLSKFDAHTLSQLKRPYGNGERRVGNGAERIIRCAEAMEQKSEHVVALPVLPLNSNFVMFDLEGMPPQFDEMEKVYLWGMQVFGENPGAFISAVSGFGPEGDRDGWFGFLQKAREILDSYGDLPFVHWASYEKAKIDLYASRYGDDQGTAARVRANLFDLLTATSNSMILPLPSLSLKVVEGYVGYKRKQTDFGGDWAMATFIEATETSDEGKRKELMDKIVAYNKEDLEATWAVFEWLRLKNPTPS